VAGPRRAFNYTVAADMYKDGLSVGQIALLVGCSPYHVRKTLHQEGIAFADRGRAAYERWAEKLIAAEAAEHAANGR
jgi:hypothetical protein